MNNTNMKMSQYLFWIDSWFSENAQLPDFSSEETKIFEKIQKNWNEKDRIELLDSLYSKYGEAVNITIEKLVRFNLVKDWKAIAAEKKDNSLDTFIDTLWGPLQDQGFKYSSKTENGELKFKVTECPIANLAKEIDGEKWIYQFICKGDYFMVEGFNSEIQFSRDKTLPEGFDCCNHTYSLK